jgi:hypothetical protein
MLNNNMTQYKNEHINILNKQMFSSTPQYENNQQHNLFLRKNYSSNSYQQFKFNDKNENDEKIIDIKTQNANMDYTYRVTRLNIDSKNRNVVPKNITLNTSIPLSNPFTLIKGSNVITVYGNTDNLSVNDKIVISNVVGQEYYLNKIEFTENSEYVKIYHKNHGMHPFDNTVIYTPYQIKIDNISNNNLTYIQNIPLNVLNDFQTVYFNTDNSFDYNPNFYYIKTGIRALSNQIFDTYFKVVYKHLYGIPTSFINANYPISSERNQGYHVIDSIDTNSFTFIVNSVANDSVSLCGGDYIVVSKIIDYIEGYPNNNNYIISLNKTFYNVSKIKLISTEFPNTEKIIKDYPPSKQNNKLYWQVIGDGDNVYELAVTPGNYGVSELTTEINNQIQNTVMSNNLKKQNTNEIVYDPAFYADVSININSNIFKLKFYGQITIVNPFRVTQDVSNSYIYYLQINHPDHLLTIGIQIRILNSLDIANVPSTSINGLQTITSIVDKDNYIVKLERFNPITSDSKTSIGGGNAVQLRYPLKSRLLFNKQDTLGNVLGFRNVGQNNSITVWDYEITNNLQYVNDILVDNVGVPINNTVINNYINLNGDNYILMTNPLFKNTVDTGNIDGVFAKLLLAGLPGYILFNQYIQLGEEFIENIQTLSELQFSFYSPDGSLYSFNGIDHSFTIEIYEKVLNKKNIAKMLN